MGGKEEFLNWSAGKGGVSSLKSMSIWSFKSILEGNSSISLLHLSNGSW